MVKAMGSSSAEWKHVSAFVSICWLTSIVCVASSEDIKLNIWSSGPAQCGENMTLSCKASSLKPLNILKFFWVRKTIHANENENDLKNQCERKNETLLILNLININENDSGYYICKLRATQGTKDTNFRVTIQACPTTPPSVNAQMWATTQTTTSSSRSLVQSTCMVVVGIVMVNLMMYC